MVRLRSKSSRPYSGRSVLRALRQRRARRSERIVVRAQKSAEAIVPGATSRQTKKPDGLTTREGLNLAGSTTIAGRRLALKPNRGAGPRASVAEKECCSILRTARNRRTRTRMYPHVRWCGGHEVNPPGYPIRHQFRVSSLRIIVCRRFKSGAPKTTITQIGAHAQVRNDGKRNTASAVRPKANQMTIAAQITKRRSRGPFVFRMLT
jgi:hypothetical protein